jgi:long-subunit fatty acid transport protein
VERSNYSGSRYDSNIDDDFNSENNSIKAEYELVYNFRVGAEYRYEKFRLRGGFNYMPDPFTYNEVDQSIKTFSGGVGYRDKKYFIDFAGIFSNTNRSRSPYFVDGPDPIAFQKYTSGTYMMTFGFLF